MSLACTVTGTNYTSLQDIATFVNALPWMPSDTPCPIHVLDASGPMSSEGDKNYVVSPLSGEFFDESPSFTGIDLQAEIDLMHLYSCPGEHFLEPSERSGKIAKLSREETRKLIVGYDVETKPLLSADGLQDVNQL